MSTQHPVYKKLAKLLQQLAREFVMACVVAGLGFVVTQSAWAAEAPVQQQYWHLSISREPLDRALTHLANQLGLQIVRFAEDESALLVVGPVTGVYTRDEALNLLLIGTGLTYRYVNYRTVAIGKETIRRDIDGGVPQRLASEEQPRDPDSEKKTEDNNGRIEMQEIKGIQRPSLWSLIISVFSSNHGSTRGAPSPAHKPLQVAALCTLMATTGNVCAQEAAGPIAPTEAGQAQLEEVIVTAQKREENLQKADIAITALSGDTLTKLNITSALDLTSVVPGLEIGQTGPGARIAMRGVVTNNDFEGGDPDVAFNVNGVYLGRQRAALSAFYDVNRIEVLRGPQGTLYGRNASAGSLNVITNLPDLTHEYASGSVGFGNYNAIEGSAVLNLPLSETLGVRAAVQSIRHDGYVNSAPSLQNYDDQDTLAGRITGFWKPSDEFSAKLIYEQVHDGGVGNGGISGGGPLGLYESTSGSGPYRWYVRPVDAFTDETTRSTTLALDWSTPIVDIAYLGNYRTDDWYTSGGTAALGPLSATCQIAVAVPVSDATNCQDAESKSKDRQFSHELRFSKNNDWLKAVAGLYYFKEDDAIFYGLDPAPGGPPPAGPAYTRVFAFEYPDVLEESKAVFAQGTFSVTDRFRLTAGARYTKDHKYRAGNMYLSAPAGSIVDYQCVNCAATAFAVNPSYANLRWSKATWKVAADFDLTPDSLLFAAVSTGYKAGGYNDGTPPANRPFNPETLTNYEIGWKNQFFDRKLQLNLDAFHMKFKDFQASSGSQDANGTLSLLTVNAGSATIDGVEIESEALVTEIDHVNINVTYLNARFTDFNLPFGDAYILGGPCATCGYSLNGYKLPYAPDFTIRGEWQHTYRLSTGGALISRIDAQYVTNQELDYHNFPSTHQPAYTRSGFSLSYEPNKTWSLMAYVRNIENRAVLVKADVDQNAPNGNFAHFAKNAYWMAPRTFGVRISANF